MIYAFVLAGVFVGCEPRTSDTPQFPSVCNANRDCAEEYVCVWGECQKPASSSGVQIPPSDGTTGLSDAGAPEPNSWSADASVGPEADGGEAGTHLPLDAAVPLTGFFDAGVPPAFDGGTPSAFDAGGFESEFAENDGGAATGAEESRTYFAVGDSVSCGIDVNDSLRCWQIDDSLTLTEMTLEANVSSMAQVSLSNTSIYGITTTGDLLKWNRNGTATTPANISTDLWTQVSATGTHPDLAGLDACGIRLGDLSCWTSEESAPNPMTYVPNASGWQKVLIGAPEICGIQDSGDLSCWFWDRNDSVPLPSKTDALRQLSLSQVDGDHRTACAVYAGGRLACWGFSGQEPLAPVGTDWKRVAVGSGNKACGINDGSDLICWDTDAAVLQYAIDGSLTTNLGEAVIAENVASVAMYDRTICASDDTGTLKCWYWNGVDDQSSVLNGMGLVALPVPSDLILKH